MSRTNCFCKNLLPKAFSCMLYYFLQLAQRRIVFRNLSNFQGDNFWKYPLRTNIHKLFETNTSFYVKQRTKGKFQFPFSQQFFDSIGKIFTLGGRLGTRHDILTFYDILRFSWNFLITLVVLERQLLCTIFITNDHASFHLSWKENLVYQKGLKILWTWL